MHESNRHSNRDQPTAARVADQQHRAEVCPHGTVEDLLALVPSPRADTDRGDPFLTLSGRAAKAWLALFDHSRRHGAWRPRHVDPNRPELTEGQWELTAHWTVAGLAHAMGVNRDTAGTALGELMGGGWVRRENPRNKGQFGGIDYALHVPISVTQADRASVAEGLKRRGVEYKGYEYRIAGRVLEEDEIKRIQSDVELEIETEQADLAGDEEKANDLAVQRMLRGLGKETLPRNEQPPVPQDEDPASKGMAEDQKNVVWEDI
jgi:hypothetical protein